MTAEDIIDDILRREGGYVDHALDKGGCTNHGITQATLADWRGAPVTAQDVRNLTAVEAREIYRQRYIVEPNLCRILDDKVKGLAVDCAVNHGPSQAVKLLQLAAHIFPDGQFGPKTEAAVNRMDARALYARLCAARIRFYGQILKRNPTQCVFAEGWLNRASEFVEAL